MANTSNVKLTIAFVDQDWDEEERETEAQRLLAEMFELDEVEKVYRPLDPHPPEGNKALGGFLVGLLTAEVSAGNAKKLWGFLGDRLSNVSYSSPRREVTAGRSLLSASASFAASGKLDVMPRRTIMA